MLRDAWLYRGFILSSVLREFQARYQGSSLGLVWSIAQPLAMILIYNLIFAGMMRSRMPGQTDPYMYSIYLCSGIIAWGLFFEALSRLSMVFVERANLIKKSGFPKICLPILVVLSALLNFGIMLVLFIVFLVISGHFPGWIIISIIPVLIVQIAFVAGLGIILGTMNVFLRDISHLINIVLQLWFWLTPVVYLTSMVPEKYQFLITLNPMAIIIASYQQVIVYHTGPACLPLCKVGLVSIALLILGGFFFRANSGEMADEL